MTFGYRERLSVGASEVSENETALTGIGSA